MAYEVPKRVQVKKYIAEDLIKKDRLVLIEPPMLREFYRTRARLTTYQLPDRDGYFVCDDLGQAAMVSTEVLFQHFAAAVEIGD